MLRIAAVTSMPSSLCNGLSMISIGNSEASLHRPDSSMPVPICCANASAAVRVPSAIRRSREAYRNDVRHRLPEQLVTRVSELLFGLHVEQDDLATPG